MNDQIRDQLIEHITTHQEKFYRLAYGYTHDRDGALDIVQNAIVKALENYRAIRNPAGINTWFYRILVNESLTYLKRHKKETLYAPELLTETLEAETPPIPAEDQALYDCVRQLPHPLKTVIMLHFYQDLTLKEVADITDTNLSTIKYRLYTALKKLRKQYEEVSL